MRWIVPIILLASAFFSCAAANAEDAREPKACEDGATASISGKIKSVDHVLAWWVTLEDGAQATCKVTVLSLDKVPAECKVGAKISASGKIIDVDIFDQKILDEVENLKCE
jgi:hypothetical protein